MIKIVEKEIVPYVDLSNECSLVVIGSFLRTENIPAEEIDMIFGHNFKYFFTREKDEINIYSDWVKFLDKFLEEHYHLGVKYCSEEDPRKAWELVEATINNNQVSLVCVSMYYLPYYKSYHQVHHPHFLIVTGYDTDDQTIIVNDPFYSYCGKLQFEDFINARNVRFGSQKNKYIKITGTNKLTSPVDKKAFFDALAENKKNLEGVGSTQEIYQGIHALIEFKAWLLANQDRDITNFSATIESFYQEALRYKNFLQLLTQRSKLLEIVDKIANEWKTMSLLFVKIKYAENPKIVRNIVQVLDKIIVLLEVYLRELQLL